MADRKESVGGQCCQKCQTLGDSLPFSLLMGQLEPWVSQAPIKKVLGTNASTA